MKTTCVSQLELDGVAAGQDSNSVRTSRTDCGDGAALATELGGDDRSRAVLRSFTKKNQRAENSSVEASTLETLLNFAESARVLGISLRQFRRLVDGGKIAFVKISERSPRVRPSELQRFLAASVVKYSDVQS